MSPLPSKAAVLAALLLALGGSPVFAQAPKETPPAAANSDEVFGEEVMLPERTLLLRNTRTSWEEAWVGIVAAFKALRADAQKLGVKVTGNPMVIYRSTADDSFEFDAALPIEAAPAKAPTEEGVRVAPSRTGKAIKFVYRGAFDAMDSTYELISNYIDTKKLNAEDLSIEEYVTDPATTKPSDIVINIYMPLKKQ
ncbi:MAG TPA: GyrI-like domain-containing protein [Xanthobacteraceae bacterium]|nr:GyrI-like domain-containing protein [Xanthobacteraceae bacterium]